MIAGLADAAEGRSAGCAGGLAVPVEDAGADFGFEALEKFVAVGDEAGGEAEAGVVGFIQRGVEIGDADDLQERAEGFLVAAFR